MTENSTSKHAHSADQMGHALRGVYARVSRVLGMPAKGIPGYNGVELQRRRRYIRRNCRSK